MIKYLSKHVAMSTRKRAALIERKHSATARALHRMRTFSAIFDVVHPTRPPLDHVEIKIEPTAKFIDLAYRKIFIGARSPT